MYLDDVDKKSITNVCSTRKPGNLSHTDIRLINVKNRRSVEGTGGGVFIDANYYIEGKNDHLLYVDDADKKD